MTAPPEAREARTGRRAAERAGRRALIEAEDFARSRAVAALQRGDSLALEDVPHRPNAFLAAGVVVALLVAAGAAGSAYLTGRAPAGWSSTGTLVVDETTGARYVAEDGVLHPAPTLTSAVLAGAREQPVLVPHRVLATAVVGTALAGADLPESVPVVPQRPAPLTACTTPAAVTAAAAATSTTVVDVWSGEVVGEPLAATGLLVTAATSTAASTADLLLVTGASAHPITAAAAEALGYSLAQVRTAAPAWLALIPRGAALAPVAVPSASSPGGIAGVGVAGDVVTVAGSDERLLVAGGQVHPFLNRTSELLAPAPVRQVSGAALAAAPRGDAVGVLDAPSSPPRVPAREDAVTACVDATSDALTLTSSVRGSHLHASPAHRVDAAGASTSVVWHQRTGAGALIGPAGVNDTAATSDPAGARGARVVAAGTAYPLADQQAIAALGLRSTRARVLDPAWLALAVTGSSLRVSR